MQTVNTQSVPSQGSPITSQPLAGSSQVPKIPQSGNQDKNRLPEHRNLAIGFTLFLIAFALLVIVWIYWSNKQKPQPQATPSPAAKIENLKTANGKIIRVDSQSETVTIESTVAGLSKTWNIAIDDKTTLAKYDEWQKAQIALLTGSSATADIASLNFTDLKIGDSVYLIARPEQDLASSEDVQGLGYLLVYPKQETK